MISSVSEFDSRLIIGSSPPSLDNWDPPQAAYLHIPFCRQRCHYCDFATGLGTPALIETYVQTLVMEIDRIRPAPLPLSTIFFGGGTPSLLSVEQLHRILHALAQRIPFTPECEISLEANPGTMTRDQLAGYRQAGINRVSLGVQAFQPHLLAACGRLHGVEEVYQAVEDLRDVGLDNFNLDLIFGLPDQTLADWQASLTEVTRIRPMHVSLYDLTIEANTRFGRLYQPGDAPLPTDADTVEMYRWARTQLMAAGYEHYEISNFALPGYQCRHNRVYWENRSYYGWGMGAVGYVQGRRLEQPKTLHGYFEQVKAGTDPQAPVTSLQDRWLDTLMVGLRLQEGIRLSRLQAEFPAEWLDASYRILDPFRTQGWLEWSDGWLRLIPPDGWLFSNTVLSALFAQFD